jgi:cytochrome c biogenesis protein CcdA
MGLLAEGFESALMACSLIVLLPGLAAALAARRTAVPTLATYGAALTGLSWLRFSDRGGDFPALVIALALAAGLGLLVAPRLLARRAGETAADAGPTGADYASLGGGFLAGVGAAELWRPCVGLEFGQVLNALPDRGITGLGQMAVYLVGVLAPLIGVGAALTLVPERHRRRAEPWLAAIGGVALGALALATAVGLHDDLVGQLFEWSIES